MTEPTELLPCPFCGGVAKAFKRTCDKTTRYDPGDRAFPIVRCGVCGACSEGDDWSEPKTAIDRWNRRSPPAGAGEPLALLVRKNSWRDGQWEAAPPNSPSYGLTWANQRVYVYTTPQPTQPQAGAGEVAERYRNAIASACEGWTMPDGLRKHLETALWSPPTPQPTQPQAGAVPLSYEQIQDLLLCGDPTDEEMRLIRIGWEAAHGIKGGKHVS